MSVSFIAELSPVYCCLVLTNFGAFRLKLPNFSLLGSDKNFELNFPFKNICAEEFFCFKIGKCWYSEVLLSPEYVKDRFCVDFVIYWQVWQS